MVYGLTTAVSVQQIIVAGKDIPKLLRKRGRYMKRKAVNSRYICITFVICLVFSIALCGCGKKEAKPAASVKSERVSWDEIEIKYSDYKDQMEKLDEYNEVIKKLESKNSLLKDMLLDADCNSIVEYLEKISKTNEGNLSANAGQLNDYLQQIRSLRPDESLDFIQKAAQNKDVDLLCVALSAVRTEEAQSEAARILGSMKNPQAVRSLLTRLSAVAFFMIGGTEGRIIRKGTRAAFVEAISKSTGLKFPDYDPNSEEDTLVVIKWTERWLKKNNL